MDIISYSKAKKAQKTAESVQSQLNEALSNQTPLEEVGQAHVDKNGVVHATLKERLDADQAALENVQQDISDATETLKEVEQQPAILKHGLNVINSDQASPLKVEFKGNTLVNLIPNFNNGVWRFSNGTVIESSRKIEMPSIGGQYTVSEIVRLDVTPNKKYLIKVRDLDIKTAYIDINEKNSVGTTVKSHYGITKYLKFTPTSETTYLRLGLVSPLSYEGMTVFEDVRLYEIDQSTYDKIGVSLTDADVEKMFPYVDSVQHVKNPVVKVEGKNLFDGQLIKGYVNTFGGISPSEVAYASDNFVNVKGGEKYVINNYNRSGILLISYYDKDKTFISRGSVSTSTPLTIPSNCSFIKFSMDYMVPTDKVQVELGTIATPYTPYDPSYLYAETTLAGNSDKKDRLSYNEGKRRWEKTKYWETDIVLDGSLDWSNETAYSGDSYECVRISLNDGRQTTEIVTKDDGTILELANSSFALTKGNMSRYDGASLRITIPNTDSAGYDLTQSSEIKRYFNDHPHKFTFQLRTPVTEPVTVEGDVSIQGNAQVEVSSGVIVREKANPEKYNNLIYINGLGTTRTNNKNLLKHLVGRVVTVYKNGEKDSKWNMYPISSTYTHLYGNYGIRIDEKDFDPTAEYTVTYEVLDKHAMTSNLNEVKAAYQNSLKSSFNQVVSKQSDIATEQTIQARQIYNMLVRLKALEG